MLLNPKLEEAFAKLTFRDEKARVRLCTVDLILAGIVQQVLCRPAGGRRRCVTCIELPRGSHDIAVTLSMVAQIIRTYSERTGNYSLGHVPGSVVVIGTDTAVHARLDEISVLNLPLSLGLAVGRIRSDGRIVDTNGQPLRFQPGRRELLYLNTRVGWPALPGERDGLVVIDATSFSSTELLDRALAWSRNAGARHVVVLLDQGNPNGIGECGDLWILDSATLSAIRPRTVAPVADSGLSTSPLLGAERPTVASARVFAPEIERLTGQIYEHLAAARTIAGQLPFPLLAAARFLATANHLVGRVQTYDQATVSMNARGTPIRDLARIIRDGHDLLTGQWATFRDTRFGALRADVSRLMELLEDDNPKFSALALLLDDLRRRKEPHRVVVRVENEAAAFALQEDIEWLDEDLADPDRVRFASFSFRGPWSRDGSLEVVSGLPTPRRRAALWSGESRHRVILAYGWEEALLRSGLRHESERVTRNAPAGLTADPIAEARRVFHYEQNPADETAAADLDLDLGKLIQAAQLAEEGLADGADSESAREGSVRSWPLLMRGVILEPGTEVLWIPERSHVEILLGRWYRHLRPSELRGGEQIIVPRGTGRDSLFARAVSIARGRGGYLDADVLLGRWRRACRRIIDSAGSLQAAERLLREAECHTVTQLRAWAEGTTIAPDDSDDIRRVAIIAGDDWLQANWKRVAALAASVRGTHIKIGQNISAAMRESVAGGGPGLAALGQLLGVDAVSILDEFDLRTVRAVSVPQSVPASYAGTIRRTDNRRAS